MTIDFLKDNLPDYDCLLYHHDLNSEFRSVRVLDEPRSKSRGQELYFGTAEAYLTLGIPVGARNLLCFGAVEDVHRLPDFESYNILLLPSNVSKPAVLNQVLAILDTTEKFAKCSDLLLRSSLLLRGDSFDLDRVMDAAYELLENPISICGADGTILCQKHIRDLGDQHAHLLRVGEAIPASVHTFHNISDLVNFNADPIVLPELLEIPLKNIVSKITIGDTIVAYFMLVEHYREIESTDITMLKMICEWLSSEFRKSSIYLTPNKALDSHFLVELLNGSITSGEEIKTRSKQLNFGLKPSHCIVAVDISGMDFNLNSPHMIRSILEMRMPNCHSLIYNDNIVLYLNGDRDAGLTSEDLNFVQEVRDTYHLRLGLSLPYYDLQNTRNAFEQAAAALRLGQRFAPNKRTYFYDHYALYHQLEHHRSKSESDLLEFCNPNLLNLLKHDREHDTPYVYTTYVLIRSGGKQMEAANQLHIHRSTMLYRMERISELTGWDFRDVSTVTRLYISYAILVLNGVLNADEYRL